MPSRSIRFETTHNLAVVSEKSCGEPIVEIVAFFMYCEHMVVVILEKDYF